MEEGRGENTETDGGQGVAIKSLDCEPITAPGKAVWSCHTRLGQQRKTEDPDPVAPGVSMPSQPHGH